MGECEHVDTCRHIQMNVDANAYAQMQRALLDKCRANCVQFVGGRNLKTCPDVRRLFKDFPDVLQHSRHCDTDNGDAT